MAVPSIDELKRPTLDLLAKGLTNSDEIRSRIARRSRVDPTATPRFTNNHAWALVRLQQEGLIQKLGPRTYGITEMGRTSLGSPPTKPAVPAPAVGAMPGWARVLVSSANTRNRAWPEAPRFTAQDLVMLWERCGGKCAITGLPFTEEKVGTGKAKRAFAPSLDRIDPEGPYTLDNCRLVMIAVNFALNAWGEEVYLKLARAAVEMSAKPARK